MTPEDKLRAAKEAEPAEVQLGDEPREMLEASLAALVASNDPPRIFIRGGRLHRFIRDENRRGALQPMSDAALRVELERVARFIRFIKKVPLSVPAPRHLIESVRARGSWPGVPPVEAIVEAPVLRPDGTVLDRTGYDAATRLIYDPAPDLRLQAIPAAPSTAEIKDALALLQDELLVDFPFVGPADKANALGLLLTRSCAIWSRSCHSRYPTRPGRGAARDCSPSSCRSSPPAAQRR